MGASNIKKKSKGAPNKGGVSMKEMVVDAIVAQKERLGSSLSAIKNHLSSKYKIDVNQKAGALNSPDTRVLKTGQGVVEYLRLAGTLSKDQILEIAKNVLLLSEKKISALFH